MNFEMTKDEAVALARFIELLRRRLPGDPWHKPGIENALAQARDRAPAPDLALAAIKAAMLGSNRTPAIIGMDGPHWQAASRPPKTDRPTSSERCSICSHRESRCRQLWTGDHEFESAAAASRRKAELDPEALHTAAVAVRQPETEEVA